MLIGRQLHFKPIEKSDAALLAEWNSDPEFVGRFANTWPETESDWEKIVAEEHERETEGTFLVYRSEEKTPVGRFGFFYPYSKGSCYHGLEIWYNVHPTARRQGIATQATFLLINHLFSSIPIERLEATTDVDNVASVGVLEKAGMTLEGVRRKNAFGPNGEWVDLNFFSITREDWGSEETYRRTREF